jgi:adenylosuccinate synthase
MRNVAELLAEAGLSKCPVEIVYVIRAYMTRHGAGPFPTELPDKPYKGIVDLTNVPNPYQGALRYGLLDLDALAETINGDLRFARGLDYEAKLAITCLDQVDHKARYIVGSEQVDSQVCDFVKRVLDVVGVGAGYVSFGPARSTVTAF